MKRITNIDILLQTPKENIIYHSVSSIRGALTIAKRLIRDDFIVKIKDKIHCKEILVTKELTLNKIIEENYKK